MVAQGVEHLAPAVLVGRAGLVVDRADGVVRQPHQRAVGALLQLHAEHAGHRGAHAHGPAAGQLLGPADAGHGGVQGAVAVAPVLPEAAADAGLQVHRRPLPEGVRPPLPHPAEGVEHLLPGGGHHHLLLHVQGRGHAGSFLPLGRLLEPEQRLGPAVGVLAHPAFVHRPQRHPVEVVPALPAPPPHDHQPGVLQHPQVLHDREPAQRREGPAQLPGGVRPVAQQVEDRPPGRVGQRLPDQTGVVVHGNLRNHHVTS